MLFNQDIAIALINKKIYNNVYNNIHRFLYIIIRDIEEFLQLHTFYVIVIFINMCVLLKVKDNEHITYDLNTMNILYIVSSFMNGCMSCLIILDNI
jgi:hypothetical protein